MEDDSGLADSRGNEGQWGQVEHETSKSIFEVVNPEAFLKGPAYIGSIMPKTSKPGCLKPNTKPRSSVCNTIKEPHIGIAQGALEAMREIDEFLNS